MLSREKPAVIRPVELSREVDRSPQPDSISRPNDPARQRGVIVLFGGYGRNNVPLDDTWEWDGRRWERVPTATAPSPRGDTRMAYDPGRERIVLFGGQSGNTNMADTWEYAGRAWTRIAAAGPTMRNSHEMVFDPRTRTTLLFGGRADLLLGGDLGPTRHDDLWAFNGRWKQISRP